MFDAALSGAAFAASAVPAVSGQRAADAVADGENGQQQGYTGRI